MTFKSVRLLISTVFLIFIAATVSAQSYDVSIYTGYQTAPHSSVKTTHGHNFTAGWEGKSFTSPPYYGIRVSKWASETLGYYLDFTHSKIYADASTLSESGFSTLEFTDGLNHLTAGIVRRFPNKLGKFSPYVSGGIGIALPHVEAQRELTDPKTFEYQFGGPVVAATLGVDYPLTLRTSAFIEYKGTYTFLNVDLSSGENLKTNIITNALNLGVSYKF